MRWTLPLLLLLTPACSVPLSPAPAQATAPAIRDITLRSHLEGTLAGDPVLRPGERVRVIPAPTERFDGRARVVVDLPATVPYRGDEAQYYLRGYAIGSAAEVNGQFM